ncbi:thioredoxin family protein [Niabella hibiscisoli]|uniref:thioredoxin family protein n=1 Tax=Niabella hibiscisoli TaxID=1825928 RepID=UPI001F0FFACD|nr:thioredoxin fold domain-containing protein [Niabella hibiscisoli]MCH5717454.1 thioredoxin family protein [Niabella hibiscisoli]
MVGLNNIVRWAIVLGSILLPGFCLAQLKAHSFEEIEGLQKTARRHLVVFVYTNWCRYCDAMKTTVFKNEAVARTLNEDYYFVQLNAEEKKDILLNNHRFKYKPNGRNTGVHELATALATIDGKLTYPALVILNAKLEIVFQYSGWLNHKELGTVLRTVSE